MVNVVLVIKSAPDENGRAAEGLRVGTAMIAMDVLPKILFADDGVYHLAKTQARELTGSSSYSERLKTISDLIGVYILSNSLSKRNLKQDDLVQSYDVKILSLDEAATLFAQNDFVIAF